MIPEKLTRTDDLLHPCPPEAMTSLWGDSMLLSVGDPEANIFGINHFHFTTSGYARYEAMYIIDGVVQLYCNKAPFRTDGGGTRWTDGRLAYEVIEPFEEIRITLDGPRFAFQLSFAARFDAFDYADGIQGDPIPALTRIASVHHGGHFEQPMSCRGAFEIRGGPSKGEVRLINCPSYRDHTWTTRMASEPPWAWEVGDPWLYTTPQILSYVWLCVALPDRYLNAFKILDPPAWGAPPGMLGIGGFEASQKGVAPIRDATVDWGPGLPPEPPEQFRFGITLNDETILHLATTDYFGRVMQWQRRENDVEPLVDSFDAFFGIEVAETGERGLALIEYGLLPPKSRWAV